MTDIISLADGWNTVRGEGLYVITAITGDLRWIEDSNAVDNPTLGETQSHVLSRHEDQQIIIKLNRRLFVNGPGKIAISDSSFGVNKVSTNQVDTFGHFMVVQPETLFANKQLFDNLPLFWDELLETGSGITSAHSIVEAATTMTSTINTAGKFTRQTFMCFDYVAGKTQQILMTGNINPSGGGDGVFTRIGQFDDSNGLFFEHSENGLSVVRRSKVTGVVEEEIVTSLNWNRDPLDGTGPSGVIVDPSKSQIFVVDYEWLSVGIVRFGLKLGNAIIYFHVMENQNVRVGAYMSTPNLPIRYQLETSDLSPASSLVHICATVVSQGGAPRLGINRYVSTEGTALTASSIGALYAVLGVRLKSTNIGAVINLVNKSMLSETNDDFEWILLLNPVVAGTFDYVDEVSSSVQVARGVTANTVSGGFFTSGGFAHASESVSTDLSNARYLGASINGTVDEFVLCVRPLSSNAKIQAGITYREAI